MSPRGTNQRIYCSCPACGATGLVDSSRKVTHLTRELYYRCADIHCGATWKANLSYVHTISPSAHGPVSQMGLIKRPPPEPLNDPLTRPLSETRPPPPGP